LRALSNGALGTAILLSVRLWSILRLDKPSGARSAGLGASSVPLRACRTVRWAHYAHDRTSRRREASRNVTPVTSSTILFKFSTIMVKNACAMCPGSPR
jgi:hypothetical protein